MPQEPTRPARIEARITPDALAVIEPAAEIQGRSVSDFVVAATQEAADSAPLDGADATASVADPGATLALLCPVAGEARVGTTSVDNH